MKGSFSLTTPRDLFQKLCHDYRRMQDDSLDSYAAFDFFVTAEHMFDWFNATNTGKRIDRQGNPLLEICSHIANGSKHFKLDERRHKSIAGTTEHKGDFSRDFSASDFDVSRLEVELKGDAAIEFGDKIAALKLANLLLEFWKRELGL